MRPFTTSADHRERVLLPRQAGDQLVREIGLPISVLVLSVVFSDLPPNQGRELGGWPLPCMNQFI